MSASIPIVFLHGWGCDSRVWHSFVEDINALGDEYSCQLINLDFSISSVEALCENIYEQLPDKCILCGWSLGGMLAIRLAALYPNKITALITLASNITFVETASWASAMPKSTFKKFFELTKSDFQKSLKRFAVLQTLSDEFAGLQKQWLDQLDFTGLSSDKSLNALTLLESIDNLDVVQNIDCPALYVFGEQDKLVPSKAALKFREKINPNQNVALLKNRGHILHYPSETFLNLFQNFIHQNILVGV
jgi:malonyl-CoA O-methyltransferase